MARERTVRDLPHAVESGGLASRLSGRRPAVFLDYDGVLTPIVDRPEDAVMPEGMRDTVPVAGAARPGVHRQRSRPGGHAWPAARRTGSRRRWGVD